MKVVLSERAIESLQDAPVSVWRTFEKQLRFLVDNLLHPSLHAKKYDEAHDLWQARVSRDWRQLPTIRTASKRSFRTQNSSLLGYEPAGNGVDLRYAFI